MAHAYETLAHGGDRVNGTLAGGPGEPVGNKEVTSSTHTETEMLETVIPQGTGTAAAIGQSAAGKTGTTSNYVDAWFVGWDSKYTVAVWVGYPEGAKPMTTAYDGEPVYGGTYPALIWHDFMLSAIDLEDQRGGHAHGG